MLKGKPIIYLNKTQTGVDEFGAVVYTTTEETIENVLYAPASTTDLPTTIDLTGKKALYTLGIPKGDTHEWKDCTVRFLGHTWKSIGFPVVGVEDMIPLSWHTKVTVELYE